MTRKEALKVIRALGGEAGKAPVKYVQGMFRHFENEPHLSICNGLYTIPEVKAILTIMESSSNGIENHG